MSVLQCCLQNTANKNITLVVKGKETEISTLKSNVEDVLAEQNVKYDKNDIISLSESCIPSLHPVQRNAAVAAATE